MKALFRLIGFLALLGAFVMLVIDGATMISSRQFELTSIGQLIALFARPGTLDRWAGLIGGLVHPLVWGLVDLVVLSPPALVVLALLGLGFARLGRRSEPDMILRMRG